MRIQQQFQPLSFAVEHVAYLLWDGDLFPLECTPLNLEEQSGVHCRPLLPHELATGENIHWLYIGTYMIHKAEVEDQLEVNNIS